jgi:hypothetical protein
MVVCHFVLFLSAILLFVLRITDSRYPFGVFQLFYVTTSFRIVNYTWWQIFVECLISWYNATTGMHENWHAMNNNELTMPETTSALFVNHESSIFRYFGNVLLFVFLSDVSGLSCLWLFLSYDFCICLLFSVYLDEIYNV